MITHISINRKSIEYDVIEIQSRSLSDPTLSDINFKNKMALVRPTLNNNVGKPQKYPLDFEKAKKTRLLN